MKILIVTCSYLPYLRSGVSSLLKNINHEFVKQGHEVFVFCARDSLALPNYHTETTTIEEVTVRVINIHGIFSKTEQRFNISDYNNKRVEPYFRKYLDEIRPNIIHFHTIQGLGANLIFITKELQYSAVITMHDFWWFCPNLFQVTLDNTFCHPDDNLLTTNQCLKGTEKLEVDLITEDDLLKRRKFLEAQLNKVDLILVNSNYLKNVLFRNGMTDIVVNENGISMPVEPISPKVPNKPLVFGFFGGISELKGFDIVQRSFHYIKPEKAILKIYGAENYNNNLKLIKKKFSYYLKVLFSRKMTMRRFINKIRSLIVTKSFNNIIFKGIYEENDVYNILSDIDMLIVASRARESFSLIVRNAFVSRTPVITSNCGGPEEIIQDGINGYIFKSGDHRDLLDKINLIIRNPEILSKFSKNIVINKIRTVSEQAQELLQFYKRVKKT